MEKIKTKNTNSKSLQKKEQSLENKPSKGERNAIAARSDNLKKALAVVKAAHNAGYLSAVHKNKLKAVGVTVGPSHVDTKIGRFEVTPPAPKPMMGSNPSSLKRGAMGAMDRMMERDHLSARDVNKLAAESGSLARRLTKSKKTIHREVEGGHLNAGHGTEVSSVASSYSTVNEMPDPVEYSVKNGIRVVNSELIATIPGSSAAEVISFVINPNKGTFPWLSRKAANYEFYKFRKLAFQVLATAGTTEDGFIVLAFDYDPTDNPVSGVAEMYQMRPNARATAWTPCWELNVPCAAMQQEKYFTRPTAPWKAEDGQELFYDCGRLLYYQEGTNSAKNWEVRMFYDVELTVPHPVESCPTMSLYPPDATTITATTSILGDFKDAIIYWLVLGEMPVVFSQSQANDPLIFTWRGEKTRLLIVARLDATTINGIDKTGTTASLIAEVGTIQTGVRASYKYVYDFDFGDVLHLKPVAPIAGPSVSQIDITEIDTETGIPFASGVATGESTKNPTGWGDDSW